MFTKDQIDNWILFGENGDNEIIEAPISTGNFLKRFLLDLKIQVNRWDYATEIIIFHIAAKSYITESLGLEAVKNYIDESLMLWGVQIYFSPLMPDNKVLALSCDKLKLSREIAAGKFDLEKLERLLNLKAFW